MRKYAGYLTAIALCLVLAAFFAFALVGYRFLAACLVALGALIGVYMALKVLAANRPKAARRLRIMLTSLVALVFLALAATEGFILSEAVRDYGEAPKYAVVLGAGVHGTVPSRSLRVRLEAALEFANENPNSFLVLSGGRGPGEDITEARCMFDWLTARGVSPDRLILEEQATTTQENLAYSKLLIQARDPDSAGVCVITAGYHIARARMMAQDQGFTQVTARGASTGMPVLEFNYYLREAPAIWWYLLSR